MLLEGVRKIGKLPNFPVVSSGCGPQAVPSGELGCRFYALEHGGFINVRVLPSDLLDDLRGGQARKLV